MSELLDLVRHTLDEKLAENIVTIDISNVNAYTDYYVICTAKNPRHANSLVEFVSPTVWRKQFSLNGKREEAKRKAIALCTNLGYKVKNDDEAEAILIGLFTLDKFVSV